jgi:hypothetical protein
VLAARKMEGTGGVEQVYVTLEEDGSDAWRAPIPITTPTPHANT